MSKIEHIHIFTIILSIIYIFMLNDLFLTGESGTDNMTVILILLGK